MKAPAEGDLVDDAVYKGFKKMRKKLGKKVLAGTMTVDEARAKMGRQFAQKGSGERRRRRRSRAAGRAARSQPVRGYPCAVEPRACRVLLKAVQSGTPLRRCRAVPGRPPRSRRCALRPEDIEAAVTKAVGPAAGEDPAAGETYTTKLAEQQRVIDAIADQPDPSTAAFSGLAFNPLRNKAAGPAGVPSQAEIAERTQQMMMRTLQDKYNASSDPAEREAYYGTLAKMRGYSGQ